MPVGHHEGWNAAVVPISGAGGISMALGVSGGDVILDVNGYYAPASLPPSGPPLREKAASERRTARWPFECLDGALRLGANTVARPFDRYQSEWLAGAGVTGAQLEPPAGTG